MTRGPRYKRINLTAALFLTGAILLVATPGDVHSGGARAVTSASLGGKGAAPSDYKTTIEAWRKDRETELRAENGWLTVAGLYWLKEGTNRFGADPSNDMVLPAGSAPGHAGAFDFHTGKTTVRVEKGVGVTSQGKPVTTMELRPDNPGPPDTLSLNTLTMVVIKRGDRYGVRLKDRDRKERREFGGLTWFPVNEQYKVTASFVAYDPPRKIAIANVLGQTEDLPCPGYASFTLGGREMKLEPVLEESDAEELFYILRDLTSGKETYAAGRFLYSERPKDGKVVLDFNKAYSPPCAFTPYATCPLPPKQNHLPIRIEAGEKHSVKH